MRVPRVGGGPPPHRPAPRRTPPAPARGPRTRLALSREIKAEADRAIAQDPGLGRAYHVRAMWNRKIAGLSLLERTAARAVLGGVPKGASMDNAVSDFQKAIELEPGYVN